MLKRICRLLVGTCVLCFFFCHVAAWAAEDAWGLDVPGVKTRIETTEKVVALTFDACGSLKDGYDSDLIALLRHEHVPATLFINARWAQKFPDILKDLAHDPLFRIENHGTAHRPISFDGESAYGIKGTASEREIIAEVDTNSDLLTRMLGVRPTMFRAGTAYYDESAIPLLHRLGVVIIGFDVNADFGATASRKQIVASCARVRPGSIIIAHMNHPEGDTAEGFSEAIPLLKRKGYRFVLLDGMTLRDAQQ